MKKVKKLFSVLVLTAALACVHPANVVAQSTDNPATSRTADDDDDDDSGKIGLVGLLGLLGLLGLKRRDRDDNKKYTTTTNR